MKSRNFTLRVDTIEIAKELVPIIKQEMDLTSLSLKDTFHYIVEDFRKSRHPNVRVNTEGLGDK